MKELCYLERHQRDNEANKIIQLQVDQHHF